MLTTAERRTATSPAPPSRTRLWLQPDPSAHTLLDGGWWPRSAARAGRTDLLTVPPHTSELAARAAMAQAAQPGNRTHTPALLAAITTEPEASAHDGNRAP